MVVRRFTESGCRDFGMLKHEVFPRLLIVGVMALASCAAPDEGAAGRLSQEAVLAIVRERSGPYPAVYMSDYTLDASGTSACAYIRVANKPPHVIEAFISKGRLRVAGPTLVRPESWETPENVALSEDGAKSCQRSGISLPPR